MLPSPFYTSVPLMTATIPNGPQRPEQLPSSSNTTRLFGHILDNSNVQQSAPLPQLRATPALGTFTAAEHGNNISQSRNTYIRGKTGRPPVYFDPADGSAAGGLVCGLESDSKYAVLKNLMASCLSPNDDSASRDSANNEASRSILCFTAENGSFRIVEALSSLAHGAQDQNRAKVIVLVAPREVEDAGMQYINSKLENIDVTILPLLIHWEDINLDHLSYMADKADPYHSVVQDMQAAIQPELHKLNLISGWFHTTHFENKPLRMLNAAFSRDHFSRSAQPLHKHKLTPGECWPPAPAWMEWILNEQPNLPEKIEPIPVPTHSQSSDSSEAGSDPNPARPVILCVDFTGFPQDNIVLQHVLADLVLKGWLDHYQPTGSSGTGRNLVVCDYPELYLSEGPFARRLQRLISPSVLASASAASRDPLPSEDTTPVLSSFGSTLSPRHANVLLLTRSPTSIPPNLLDSLSYLVIHRFTSPRCLKALQEHFFLSDGAIRHSLDSQENDGKRDDPISSSVNALYDPRLMERIMSLREDQVLLFTTSQTKTPFAYSERVASDTSTNRNETIQPPSKPQFKLPFKGGHQRRLVLVRLFSDEQEDEVDLKEEIEEPVTRNVDLSKSMVYSSSAPHLGRSPLQTQAQVLPGQSLLGQTLGSHPQVEIGGYNTSHHQAVRHTPSAVPPKIWGPSVVTTDSTTISGSAALGGETEFFLTPGRGAGIPAVGVIGSRGNNNTGIIGSTDFNSGANHYSNPQSTVRLSPTTSRGMRATSPFTLGATGNQLSTALAYSPGPISPPILGNKSGFSPFVSPRNERDVYPLGSSPQLPNDFRGFQHPGHDQNNNFHVPSEVQSSSGKESRDDSSAGYVEGGAASGGGSSSSFSGGQAAGNPASPSNAGGYGFAALGLKRSYAGVTAPPNLQDSVGSNSTASYSNTNRSTFGPTTSSQDASSPTTEPPTYPLSFFWPLLDALEKARQQVSTPHNRAQSVRHSVVGQELPPTARARLALTFKEYVAAAARAGVIVTGDSGDKAWIALREWKYPGKGLGGLGGGSGSGSASGGGGGSTSASGSGGAGGSRVASK